MSELENEISALITYLAPGIKETHKYFSKLSYVVNKNRRYAINQGTE